MRFLLCYSGEIGPAWWACADPKSCFTTLGGNRAACLIDAFLPTPASIEALSAVLERFFPSASTAGGRSKSWRLVQHAPSEQLYLVHPALIQSLSDHLTPAGADERPSRGVREAAAPIIWLDARSTIRAGTRLTRAPSHLAKSLEALSQRLQEGEALIYLEGLENTQNQETQQRKALEGVSLAGLLLEYGGVYSLLGEPEESSGAHSPSDGRNNLSGEPLIVFTLSFLPPGDREGLGERSVLSFSIPLRALHPGEKEQLVEWTKERTRGRIQRLKQLDKGDQRAIRADEASKDFVQWLTDCTVQVKAREVALDLVGL